MSTREHKFEVGGIWDDPDWSLIVDSEENDRYGNLCPHAIFVRQEKDYKVYRMPAIIVAHNQGRHDSTGVCLHCVLEGAKKVGVIP